MACYDVIPTPNGWYDKNGQKFLLTHYSVVCANDWLTFTCTTDVAIHLFALSGITDPELVQLTHMKRGIASHHDWKANYPYIDKTCQAEAGDTLTHTITIPLYTPYRYAWWICLGVTLTPPIKWSPSRSPFFYHCCPPPSYTNTYYCAQASSLRKYSRPYAYVHDTTCASSWMSDPLCGQSSYATWRWAIHRAPFFFDVTNIPPGKVVTGAILRFYCQQKLITNREFNTIVQQAMPTYPHEPPVLCDYEEAYYSGDGGSIYSADVSTPAWNEFDLNITGKQWLQAAINDSRHFKIMLRSQYDISSSPPGNGVYQENWIRFRHVVGQGRITLKVTYY